MPEAVDVSMREPSRGYQLRVVQEVLLALLAKEASHGYQVRARLQLALGPLAEALNAGHVYVTLNRLEKAGLVSSKRVGQADRPDRKVYELTEAGRERVMEWLADTSWPKPAPAKFHLKLVAAARRSRPFSTSRSPTPTCSCARAPLVAGARHGGGGRHGDRRHPPVTAAAGRRAGGAADPSAHPGCIESGVPAGGCQSAARRGENYEQVAGRSGPRGAG